MRTRVPLSILAVANRHPRFLDVEQPPPAVAFQTKDDSRGRLSYMAMAKIEKGAPDHAGRFARLRDPATLAKVEHLGERRLTY